MEIAAGTPVECLICMQTFAAEPQASAASPAIAPAQSMYTADMPTMSDTATASMPKATAAPKTKPASAAPVPVSKPASMEIAPRPMAPVPVAVKANPDADLPAAAPIRKPAGSPMGGKLALLAVALGLAFLLTGGIVFAIVKITASTRSGSPQNPAPQVADNGKKPGPDNLAKDIGNPANMSNPDDGNPPPSQDGQGSSNAVVSKEEDEQIRNKVREEAKQLLKRKIPSPVAGGEEPAWQPAPADPLAVGQPQPVLAPGLNQQKINVAIDRGVFFLKATQGASGTWNTSHGVGHAAIGGLTLLECKAPTNDPSPSSSWTASANRATAR
jgi:hypothetical protein